MLDIKEFKERYYKAFFDEKIVNSAFDMFIEVQQQRIDNIDTELPKALKKYKEYEKKKQNKDYSKEKVKDFKDYATKEGFLKTNKEIIQILNIFKERALKSIKEDDTTYKNAVNYFTKGDKIENITELEEIKWFVDCSFLSSVFLVCFELIVAEDDNTNKVPKLIKEYESKKHNIDRYFDSFIDNGKHIKDFANNYGLEFSQFYLDIITYIINILESIVILQNKINDFVKGKIQSSKKDIDKKPLNSIEYNSFATLTDTPLINELARTTQEVKDIYLLNELNFKIKNKTITKNEEELKNNLTELDRFVLDTIAVDLFLNQHITTFSDRQIAIQYTKEKGGDKTSQTLIKNINDSILKLQNKRIDLDYASVEKYKKNNVYVSMNNPLLWLESMEVTTDTTSHYYRIIGTPFYCTYLKETNSKLFSYERKLLTEEIKGIEKNTENQNLKHYLIRRILSLKNFNNLQRIYISTSDIYEVQGVNSVKYTTENKLKKARLKARERTEKILNLLQEDYDFNFNKDNRNKRIKGYYITLK